MYIYTYKHMCSYIISLFISVYLFSSATQVAVLSFGLLICPSPAARLAVSGTERGRGRNTDGRSERGRGEGTGEEGKDRWTEKKDGYRDGWVDGGMVDELTEEFCDPSGANG